MRDNHRNFQDQADFIGKGFKQLDENLCPVNPPRIAWGDEYKQWGSDRKIKYLEKLASTMNYAAWKIQEERNQLQSLCERKEKQIEALKQAIEQNNNMIQQQIAEMNAKSQGYHKVVKQLDEKIRKLESGNNS